MTKSHHPMPERAPLKPPPLPPDFPEVPQNPSSPSQPKPDLSKDKPGEVSGTNDQTSRVDLPRLRPDQSEALQPGQLKRQAMAEPTPNFERRKTEDGGWSVFLVSPSGQESQVGSFLTEAEALTWIASDSPVWLQKQERGETA